MFYAAVELGVSVDVINGGYVVWDQGEYLFASLHIYFGFFRGVSMLEWKQVLVIDA